MFRIKEGGRSIRWIALALSLMLALAMLSGCSLFRDTVAIESTAQPETSSVPATGSAIEISGHVIDAFGDDEEETETETEPEETFPAGFNEKISYDNVELTTGKEFSLVRLESEWSGQNGAMVAEVPVHIKNTGTEAVPFYSLAFKAYDGNGAELESVSAFFKNDLSYAADIQPGAEADSYVHFLYGNDGEYTLEFILSNIHRQVKIDIAKDNAEAVPEETTTPETSETTSETTEETTPEETVPPHTHNYTSSTVAATCTAGGYTVHTCSCGDSYTDSYTSALGHNYKSYVEVEATCSQEGLISYECTRCGKGYAENTPKTDHEYAPWVDEHGNTVMKCKTCDKIQE